MKKLLFPLSLAVTQACADPKIVDQDRHVAHHDGPRETVCDSEDVLNDYYGQMDTLEPVTVPVCVHRVLEAETLADYSEEDKARVENWYRTTLLAGADRAYTHVNFHVDSVDFVVHENAKMYTDFGDSDEALYAAGEEIHEDLAKPGCLNIYYVPENEEYITVNDGFSLGTYSESSNDLFLLMQDATATKHELGHALGLWHTHDVEHGDSVLHPDQPYTTGDLIPDTAPDPGLYRIVDYETGESVGDCTVRVDTYLNELLEAECREFPEYAETLPWNNVMAYYGYQQELTPYQQARAACYAANYHSLDGPEGGVAYDFVYERDQ